MKNATLKRLLAFMLAAVMMLSLTACFDDDTSTKDDDYKSEYDGPTLRVPGQDNTFPTFPDSNRPTTANPTTPKDPQGNDTVTVYARVPSDWTAPYCWAWNDTQNAFSSWPGKAMVKKGNWYQVQVPNWINSVIISNNGAPQTDDLVVLKGYDVWLVVESNGSVSKYYNEPQISEPSTPSTPTTPTTPTTPGTLQHKDLAYVMIYNPNIYDQNKLWNTTSLTTGYLGSQIDVNAHRGSGLEEENTYTSVSQDEWNKNFPWDEVDFSGGRADGLSKDYNVGDTKQFYCSSHSDNAESRSLQTLTCVYSGEHCHIWSDGSASNYTLTSYGKEFDNNIFDAMTTTFGTARFVGKDGKVNFLFYDIEPSVYGTILGGYFWKRDLVSSDEVNSAKIQKYGMNPDHAILHINTNCDRSYAISTMAHEFQHLICFSTGLEASEVYVRTWLDEAMSGYTEQMLYPGSKTDDVRYFNNSGLIRKGQSLYNFKNGGGDIGVYGSVYLFTEYLKKYAGSDVFSKIHDYWRNSYSSTLSEAEAIYNSVPASFRNEIDKYITYSGATKFASKEEAWMSKLTLHFYLVMFSKTGNLPNYNYIDVPSLLYDEMSGATIEGGGRIVLATKDTSFEIPKDADPGLIYVGLDKNFQVVTSYVP